jgi:hypothetical protein
MSLSSYLLIGNSHVGYCERSLSENWICESFPGCTLERIIKTYIFDSKLKFDKIRIIASDPHEIPPVAELNKDAFQRTMEKMSRDVRFVDVSEYKRCKDGVHLTADEYEALASSLMESDVESDFDDDNEEIEQV